MTTFANRKKVRKGEREGESGGESSKEDSLPFLVTQHSCMKKEERKMVLNNVLWKIVSLNDKYKWDLSVQKHLFQNQWQNSISTYIFWAFQSKKNQLLSELHE